MIMGVLYCRHNILNIIMPVIFQGAGEIRIITIASNPGTAAAGAVTGLMDAEPLRTGFFVPRRIIIVGHFEIGHCNRVYRQGYGRLKGITGLDKQRITVFDRVPGKESDRDFPGFPGGERQRKIGINRDMIPRRRHRQDVQIPGGKIADREIPDRGIFDTDFCEIQGVIVEHEMHFRQQAKPNRICA